MNPEEAHERFLRGKLEYEDLRQRVDSMTRTGPRGPGPRTRSARRSEGNHYTKRDSGAGAAPKWGTGEYRWSTDINTKLTPLQQLIKTHLTNARKHLKATGTGSNEQMTLEFSGAVDVWERSGGDPGLLLFLLEVCIQLEISPPHESVKRILRILHNQEHTSKGTSTEWGDDVVKETGIALWNGKKTQAYNDLIRVCTFGNADATVVYEVLGEMYANNVDKDQETFHNIDQAWQNMRQDYVC